LECAYLFTGSDLSLLLDNDEAITSLWCNICYDSESMYRCNEKNDMSKAKFAIGQIVEHKMFDYRGVIVDVDACYQGTDEWYEHVARSRPPKEKPWYRVLVDNAEHETYVAERNLLETTSLQPIKHPLIDVFFKEYKDGYYSHKHHCI